MSLNAATFSDIYNLSIFLFFYFLQIQFSISSMKLLKLWTFGKTKSRPAAFAEAASAWAEQAN